MPVPYDKLVDRYFVVQDDGTVIFRAGVRGRRGYRVPSPERERAIRAGLTRRLKIWRWILSLAFLSAIVGGSFSTPSRFLAWGLAAGILLAAWLYLTVSNRALTRGLESISVPLVAAAPSSGYLERFAARQSAGAHLVQAIALGGLAVYMTENTIKVGATAMDVVALVILWPLAVLGAAGFLTRISKRSTMNGPSPDQLYMRSIRRPIWLVIIALLAIALFELVVQANHRAVPPTRQVRRQPVPAWFDNSLPC